jgi:hypothetical protein
MRTQKSVDGVKINYYYDSNKNLIALVKGNDTLLFYYDSDGSTTPFSYNGTMYFYVKNLQGDVVRIIDLSGTEVASYVYDSWENIKDTKGDPTIREINLIRYRGYLLREFLILLLINILMVLYAFSKYKRGLKYGKLNS